MRTHTLRRLDSFSAAHPGPASTIRNTASRLYAHLNRVGLATELESAEIYRRFVPEDENAYRIQVRASFLAWPEIYRQQSRRVFHLPKVAFDREAYDKDQTPDRIRKAYCLCPPIREAENPSRSDPLRPGSRPGKAVLGTHARDQVQALYDHTLNPHGQSVRARNYPLPQRVYEP